MPVSTPRSGQISAKGTTRRSLRSPRTDHNSQDCLVHWSGSVFGDDEIRLVDEATILPYQEGSTLYDSDTSTEIISNSNDAVTNAEATHAREVFMIWWPPLILSKAPNVRSSDESESNISPNALEYDGETKSQKRARERKNKLKEGRKHRARQCKEAWTRYESDLAKYGRKKSEQKAEERCATGRANNSPYDRIKEPAKELEAISTLMKNKNDLGRFSGRQP
jgi:hypothetical protein